MANPKKIVITGAPSTGKTTLINDLEAFGYCCFHEVIRSLTASARKVGTQKKQVSNPLVFVDDPLEFNTRLLHARKEQYQQSFLLTTDCFFDRGTCDVLAYMDFFKQAYDEPFEAVCREFRYDQVFVLPPWEAIYVTDNERLETFAEAGQLHHHLMVTYKRFGYDPVLVPKAAPAARIDFVLNALSCL